AGELPTGIDGSAAHRQGEDLVVRVRVPRRGRTARRIERGDEVAWLPANAGEAAAGVDQPPAHSQGFDVAVVLAAGGVRVPGGRGTRRGIECGDVVAWLTADVAEMACDIDRAPAHNHGANRDFPVRVRVPGGWGTRCCIQ